MKFNEGSEVFPFFLVGFVGKIFIFLLFVTIFIHQK